jgi:hypothetical protein
MMCGVFQAAIAGKSNRRTAAPTGNVFQMWERGLPAMNDHTVS